MRLNSRTFYFSVVILVMSTNAGMATSDSWPHEPEEACKRRLFGDPLDSRQLGSEGIAIVIYLLDECELDRRIIISERGDEIPEIQAVTTVKGSISSQLKSIRQAKPEVNFDEACDSIRVEFSEKLTTSPQSLSKLLEDFKSILVKPTIDAPFVIHGTFYEIWVFSGANHSYFEFQGAFGAKQNPLQRWVDAIVSASGLTCQS